MLYFVRTNTKCVQYYIIRCNINPIFTSTKMLSGISENILIYKLKAHKDSDAFAALYDIYVKRIYRFVYFKVNSKEEAEDLTSEVFLKAWNYINENKELKSFSGLLYKIARNCIIDLYRAKSVKSETILISSLPEGIEPGDKGREVLELNVGLEAQDLIKVIKKLKLEYQEVLTLRYVDELQIEEIAEIMGKGNISVRVTLHRALKKLKSLTGIE